MGACDFVATARRNGTQDGFTETLENGARVMRPKYRESTAAEAFENLAENDRYENGHSYSGCIGMKQAYDVLGTVDTLEEAQAQAYADLERNESKYCDKWHGKAACLTIRQGDIGFLFWGIAPS